MGVAKKPAGDGLAERSREARQVRIKGLLAGSGLSHVAYVLHDEETGRDTLHIAVLGPGTWGVRGIYDGEKIEGLCWARDPITVGFLDSTETTGKDGKRRVNSALYTWHVTGPSVAGKFTRVDTPQ